MQISGVVEEITFRNDDNGYTVLDLDMSGELVTCVGVFSYVFCGESLELTGEYKSNAKYGNQFAVKSYVSKGADSSNLNAIRNYIGSGLIKGIGEAIAARIVEKFGKDTLTVMELSPKSLSSVKGISSSGAVKIGEQFANIKKMQEAVMFLQKFEVSVNLSIRIYNEYKEKTKEFVGQNPYKLVEDIDGIGFLTADRVAQKMGIEATSPFRMRAGILHVLKNTVADRGSTYILLGELYGLVCSLLSTKTFDVFEATILSLKIDGVITVFDKKKIDDNGETKKHGAVAMTNIYKTESQIATKLVLLNGSNQKIETDAFEQSVKLFEKQNKISFHQTQKEAILSAISNNFCVITGGPGTGKTTIIRCIYTMLKNQKEDILLLAPTGRAAKRLSESVGADASTIHRGLEVKMQGGKPTFVHNEYNKLPATVVIVDEVSMLDCNLCASLIKAVKNDCKLIFVGDHNQLPSVGAGNVLGDIIDSNLFAINFLTQIFRTSENSFIAKNAYSVLSGNMPVLDNSSDDFFFKQESEAEDIAKTIVDMVAARLPKFLNTTPSAIQVLAPMKVGTAGIDSLNRKLQERLNPQKTGQAAVEFERAVFRVNDKVMQIQNNYEIEWIKNGIIGSGIFNGDIGTIKHIQKDTHEVEIEFDDGRNATYARTDLYQLTHAYAITIHKSQGCEFDCVVMPVVFGAPLIFTRNLLYTAITRAKRLVVLVGTKGAISGMIKNNYIEKRSTNLKDFLIEQNKKFKQLYED